MATRPISQGTTPPHRRKRERGTALIEFPVYFLMMVYLFLGAYDMGLYLYALIAVQNAARVAALYTSSNTANQADATGACQNYVIPELQNMTNASSFPATCNASPLKVTVTIVAAPDGTTKTVSKVSVAYQTSQMISIPGLPARMTVTRAVQMRVRG